MVISSNRKGIDGMSTLSDYIADFLKSLADPVKIDLIKLLKNNKKNSKEIQEELDISQAHASQKVNELIKTGILSSEKIENIKYYTLKNYDILKFLSYSASFVLDLEKKRLENLLADFLKSLADPVKIDLIKLLKNNKKNSKEIQEELDISQAHASQKVNELIKTGILSSEKIENIKYYTLKNYDILKFLSYSASFVLDLEKKRLENLRKMDDIEKVF